jgi:glycine dehydrogenase subunit 1
MGPTGLQMLAELSMRRAHVLADSLCQLPGVELAFDEPFFNEFVLRTGVPAKEILAKLKDKGVLGGLDCGVFYESEPNGILVTVTEMNKPESLERYVQAMKEILPAKTNNPKPVEAGKSV